MEYADAADCTSMIALSRKNALFAGSDERGAHWGVIASLIEPCKLSAVDPEVFSPMA